LAWEGLRSSGRGENKGRKTGCSTFFAGVIAQKDGKPGKLEMQGKDSQRMEEGGTLPLEKPQLKKRVLGGRERRRGKDEMGKSHPNKTRKNQSDLPLRERGQDLLGKRSCD